MTISKKIKATALVLSILTIIWVVLTAISMAQVEPSWNNADYIFWVANPDIIFIGNYINATLLTIVVVILYTLLYSFIKSKYESSAITGLLFIPVYGVINLLCYSIQISVVPSIIANTLHSADTVNILAQLIQANSRSLVGFMNGLAYAILGIPSIIFGYLLIQEKKKYSGLFLLLNGALCIIGIIGYMVDIKIMASGIMIGGVVFLISLFCMIFEFKNNE